jgi:hypothetical protein
LYLFSAGYPAQTSSRFFVVVPPSDEIDEDEFEDDDGNDCQKESRPAWETSKITDPSRSMTGAKHLRAAASSK